MPAESTLPPAAPHVRQCIACRAQFPRETLVKLTVCKADGAFSIDNSPPLQGRSAYVCRKSACLSDALKAKKFNRTLKCAIPDDIVGLLNELLKGL